MTNAEQRRARYRTDQEYRRRTIDRIAEHQRKMAAESAAFRELKRVRNRICSVRDSIEAFREKIERKQALLRALGREKERLELAYGRERAARKRAKRA